MPKNATRVVLVDDNPLILDLMREGIEPLADTFPFQDSAEAFLY